MSKSTQSKQDSEPTKTPSPQPLGNVSGSPYKDFKKLKVGDKFVESEYGSTYLLTVTTKPTLERPDYMTFEAVNQDGKTIEYGFSYPSGPYNPTIWEPEVYGFGPHSGLNNGSDLKGCSDAS